MLNPTSIEKPPRDANLGAAGRLVVWVLGVKALERDSQKVDDEAPGHADDV